MYLTKDWYDEITAFIIVAIVVTKSLDIEAKIGLRRHGSAKFYEYTLNIAPLFSRKSVGNSDAAYRGAIAAEAYTASHNSMIIYKAFSLSFELSKALVLVNNSAYNIPRRYKRITARFLQKVRYALRDVCFWYERKSTSRYVMYLPLHA